MSQRLRDRLLVGLLLSFISFPAIAGEPEAPEATELDQVTSVSQLTDVQPTDWAFQALQSLVERYGCIAGYPDKTFRGNRALTRYEFAAGLNACLDRVNELIAASTADLVKQEDLEKLKTLQTQFSSELTALRGKVDTLEARTAKLESQQFSTTTKMNGFSVIGVQGRTPNRGDRNPRDGQRDTDDPGTNFNVITNNYLSFTTQFSPRDFLYFAFWQQNGSGDPRLTNDARVGYDAGGFPLYISDLKYHFMVTDKLVGMVGTEGIYSSLAFRGPNRAEGAFTGPVSYFAQRNPILNIGFGRGGVAFDWQFAKRASLQAIYSTNIPGFFPNSIGGKGHNTAGVQLAVTPTDQVDVALYYINNYSPNGQLLSFVGDAQLTAIDPVRGSSAPTQTNAFGGTVNWQINPRLNLGGWFGYTNSYIPGESGRVETTNYMVYLNFLDLFGKGNLGGLYVGQPPKITRSSLPIGSNIPDSLNTGLGRSGGQPGTTTHVEAFYRWQLNNNISVTPGLIWIIQPGHTPDSDSFVTGVVRTTFAF
ncbi:iron uptake porin [Leptolyngbya boryana CZ1]|uniref:Iron uptake porin n=1 Tax=Leptolyngbya boryana CZ1 TaxID=3060204 RepID=A0AA97ASK7_LEPBY|nr:iron uptake porin [Leptolyngbya boryana]WNZ44935.1 iron uptake porin [Leptolyngbya boryana CZ1]